MLEYASVTSLVAIPLIVSIALLYNSIFMANYKVHVYMTKTSTINSGRADFKTFKKQFDSFDWEASKMYKESLFDRNDKATKIHASIFMFNGKGMVMKNHIEYNKAYKLIKLKLKELEQEEFKW